jgi:hypothetical protein
MLSLLLLLLPLLFVPSVQLSMTSTVTVTSCHCPSPTLSSSLTVAPPLSEPLLPLPELPAGSTRSTNRLPVMTSTAGTRPSTVRDDEIVTFRGASSTTNPVESPSAASVVPATAIAAPATAVAAVSLG